MISIGDFSKQTGVKIPTIRYYEEIGLLKEPERSAGNQRRYDKDSLKRLSFIKHARDLGFSLDSVSSLIDLQNYRDRSCHNADNIAQQQLDVVTKKLKKLKALQSELRRITKGCEGGQSIDDCYVLASLADHALCSAEH